jgi:hypothetical protein
MVNREMTTLPDSVQAACDVSQRNNGVAGSPAKRLRLNDVLSFTWLHEYMQPYVTAQCNNEAETSCSSTSS